MWLKPLSRIFKSLCQQYRPRVSFWNDPAFTGYTTSLCNGITKSNIEASLKVRKRNSYTWTVSWSTWASITKCHSLVASKQQKVISQYPGGWKSKTRVLAEWGTSSESKASSCCCILRWQTGRRDLLGTSYIRAPIPFKRVLPSWPNHPQRLCFLILSPWGVRIST